MGVEWQRWDRRRVGGRVPRSFAPKVVRFRRRGGTGGSDGSRRTLLLALLFLAAIAFIAMGRWQAADTSGGGWSDAPIEWNEVQPVPRAPTDPRDADWERRGREEEDRDTGPSGSARFGLCHSGGGTDCVVDGDTIWFGGVNIRIADIDAPETHEPRCAAEQALGERATRRLHELVNGGAITLGGVGRDSDRYGRKLRIVAVDGVGVGETLVGEGLARWYDGGPRRGWCG